MINIGDIVYQRDYDGLINLSRVGLVIDTRKPEHTRRQYRVIFSGGIPAWWEENYLAKIKGEENDL